MMGLVRLVIKMVCILILLKSADARNLTRLEILSKLLNNPEYDSTAHPNFDELGKSGWSWDQHWTSLAPIETSCQELLKCWCRIHCSGNCKCFRAGLLYTALQCNATKVTVQVDIANIHSVSELSMDFTLEIILRQKWFDHRMRFDEYTDTITRLELDQKLLQKVWVPDTIFTNEKKAEFHDVTVPNRIIRLYKNGTVYYSSRISLKLGCLMKLEKYPLDSQTCSMNMKSYAYSTENLILQWHDTEPVKLEEVTLPRFYIESTPTVKKNTKDYGEDGKFTCLQVMITLNRNCGYYAMQIFVPSILIVLLSCVSFLIDVHCTSARISLGVLTVLTMTSQSAGALAELPRVPYVKAIDVWMTTCLVFVFGSLLEFALANVLLRRTERYAPSNNVELVGFGAPQIDENENPSDNESSTKTCSRCSWSSLFASKLDKISLVGYLLLFVLFNIGFWIYFLI